VTTPTLALQTLATLLVRKYKFASTKLHQLAVKQLMIRISVTLAILAKLTLVTPTLNVLPYLKIVLIPIHALPTAVISLMALVSM
jgi:hypothetical protein